MNLPGGPSNDVVGVLALPMILKNRIKKGEYEIVIFTLINVSANLPIYRHEHCAP